MYYSKSHFNTTPGDYKIHTYDKIHDYNRVHDYNRIHEYNKIHEYDKIREYNKIREYKYQEYKPTQTEPRKQRPPVYKQTPEKRKRKRKSSLSWPDKPIYTHTYRPYEYIPPPKHREYEYKEYKMSDENYIKRKIHMYKGNVDYKLTPDNYYPFRYRKGSKRKSEDYNSNNDMKRETSLRDIALKESVYQPEYRREEVLPSAIMIAPVKTRKTMPVKKPQSPKYIPEDRREEVLPSAIVIAPAYAIKVPVREHIKPPSPIYKPEFREEEVLPSAFVIAPIHPTITSEPVKSSSPQVQPVPIVARTTAAGTVVRNVSPVRKPSPIVSTKRVYTPIGSRSPSPISLVPVGAAISGGIIASSVVNKNTVRQPPIATEQKQTTSPLPSPSKSRSPSPKVQKALIVGGAAGAATAVPGTNSNPKSDIPPESPKQKSPSVHSLSPINNVIVAGVVVTNTPQIDTKSKPLTPPPQRVNPTKPPTSPIAETSEPVRSAPTEKEPEIPKQAPVVAMVAPLQSKNTRTINERHREVPSSWSPPPKHRTVKKPSSSGKKFPTLPPEVIATIEAYDIAHGM